MTTVRHPDNKILTVRLDPFLLRLLDDAKNILQTKSSGKALKTFFEYGIKVHKDLSLITIK